MDHQAGLAPGVLTGACPLLRHWLTTEFTAGLIPAGSKPWARDHLKEGPADSSIPGGSKVHSL